MEANYRRRRSQEYRMSSHISLEKGLVLRRAVGEQIQIGDDILITLLATDGPTGEIHIHAPLDVAIGRPERSKRGR